ncbi:MAG TPA: carboxypeptidase-like regulatory domain-containing protein [Thermodesulfobacteriota bacterium]|nr:carboxypeptidase-like regulatory domain-containing protein [Thermodesulfobacteriota bacterium]
MAIIFPYVTSEFTAYEGEKIITVLSLAVRLIDDFTEEETIGNVKVTIKEGDIKAFKNLSGYYLFKDMNPGNYNFAVGSDFYLPEEMAVNLPQPDPKNPVVEVTLKPKPSYPFPRNATLVRGLVSDGNPVVDADVSVVGKTIETKTDEKGEFVLYFKGIKQEAITVEVKKGGNTKSVNTTVEEGKTVSLGIVSFP